MTESLLLDNVEEIIDKMTTLKAWGIGFSLDDFGTGFSSLSYLKRLPLDQLKIDQSFVRDLLSDANDVAIARTIVTLAHSLGLSVIAEGVENEAQRDCLSLQGCHAYQGYLFGRPLPITDFEQLLQAAPLVQWQSNEMGEVAEWPNVPDSKSGVPQGTVGSNPTFSSKNKNRKIPISH